MNIQIVKKAHVMERALLTCVWVVAVQSVGVGALETAPFGKLHEVEKICTAVFAQYSTAVVGITSVGPSANAPAFGFFGPGEGSYSGTGAVISADGLILTSVTTVPKKAHDIKVYFADGHVRPAKFVDADEGCEGSLIKVEDAKPLTFMKVSNSKDYKVGDPVYTWGNPFNSIQIDGGVSYSGGNISGLYLVSSVDDQSKYAGPAIETDAAVNPGSDGGPLTDSEGNLIGVMTLAYSRTRWLGLAIPSANLAEKLSAVKPLLASRRMAPGTGENAGCTAIQAAYQELAEKVGGAVIALRVVREHDTEEAPATLKGIQPKPAQTIETDRGELELMRPPHALASAFLVSADGVAVTTYFNVDAEEPVPAAAAAGQNPRRRRQPQPGGRKKAAPTMRTNAIKKIYAYLEDGTRVEAKLLGTHKTYDLAALKLDLPAGKKVPFLELDAAPPKISGASVAIFGRSEAPGDVTLNTGLISAAHRFRETCFQTSALMNYGNLGGPIVDLDGKVQGMAGMLTPDTEWRQNCGVGFGLLASKIKSALPELIAGKNIEGIKRAFLGVEGDMSTVESDGAHIASVMPGQAGAKGGLKAGDIVVEYNGRTITDWNSLVNTTITLNAGDAAKLKVKRGGQTVELTVVLGARPNGI